MHPNMAKKISTELEKQICNLYNDGYGTMEIFPLCNISRATVQKTLIRNGINLRKTTPYKNKYNIKFFDTYTPESCYWAGFILADGCIRTDRAAVEIHLQESDKEHLLKFAKTINYTGNLHYDKHSNAYTLSIAGEWFPKALKENFSLEGRKSLKVKFPTQVPEEYWSDLIRGIFDGDGCISKQICPQVSIIGTKYLINFLRNLFFDWGVRLKSKNIVAPLINQPNAKIKSISYAGKNAKIILDKLYKCSSPETRLDRKFKRYTEYYEIIEFGRQDEVLL